MKLNEDNITLVIFTLAMLKVDSTDALWIDIAIPRLLTQLLLIICWRNVLTYGT